MPGDNFAVRVASEGREHFEPAVKMAFSGNAPGGKATHYLNGIKSHQCRECFGKGSRSVHVAGQDKVQWRDRKSSDIVCDECGGKGIISARSGMILYWSKPEDHTGAIVLPFPLTAEAAVTFLWDWLQTAEYRQEPDQDGDNGKGFIVTTGDFWGHCDGSHYSIVMVTPDWQMYGK